MTGLRLENGNTYPEDTKKEYKLGPNLALTFEDKNIICISDKNHQKQEPNFCIRFDLSNISGEIPINIKNKLNADDPLIVRGTLINSISQTTPPSHQKP